MAIYQLKTFSDIIAAIREELKIPSMDTTTINRIKRDINMVYLNEVVPMEKWNWLRGSRDLSLPAKLYSGSASVSANSATVTLSVSIALSVRGYWFSVEGQAERYKISQHTAGASTLTLESPFNGATNTGLSYMIWTDAIPLPADCREVFEVTNDLAPTPLEGCGLQKFRKYVNTMPKLEGVPAYYSVSDYVDPAPYESISGIPASVSRASAGLVKTLVFASDMTSYLSVGDSIEVTGAADSSFNIQAVVSSVTSTSITYTGVDALDASSTADTGFIVKRQASESYIKNYREMLVYPAISTSRVILHVDYIKDAPPLEDDTDEPIIPIQDRIILVYGALAKAWPRERNPEEGARNQALFDRKLAKMSGKLDDSTDTPILRPSRVYLGTKRARVGVSAEPYGMGSIYGLGSAAAGQVYGTPYKLAYFNSSGNLDASSLTLDSTGALTASVVDVTSASISYLSVTSTAALVNALVTSLSATSVSATYLSVTSTASIESLIATSISVTDLNVTSVGTLSGLIVNGTSALNDNVMLSKDTTSPVYLEINNNSLSSGDAYLLIDVDGTGVPLLGFERPSANWSFGIHSTQNFQLCKDSTLNSNVIMEFDNSTNAITFGISTSTATHTVNGALGVVRRAGIDGASSANYSLRLGQATTLSGSTQGGLNIANTVTSSSTTQAIGVISSLTTSAASFTVPNLYHFLADNPALGSGSTVTRYYSFYATTPTRGTNNASFADNTSFTGNWFINQSGTRASTFAGVINATAGLTTKVSTANVSNPPTDAELDSAFGTPATVGSGFIGIVNDNNAGTNEYMCWSDGTNWFYTTGTKAV